MAVAVVYVAWWFALGDLGDSVRAFDSLLARQTDRQTDILSTYLVRPGAAGNPIHELYGSAFSVSSLCFVRI